MLEISIATRIIVHEVVCYYFVYKFFTYQTVEFRLALLGEFLLSLFLALLIWEKSNKFSRKNFPQGIYFSFTSEGIIVYDK